MIPEHIILKYSTVENPYRKLFLINKEYIACDFSDQIPSWRLELSDNCSANDLRTAISFAESKKYFSFYNLCSENCYESRKQKVEEASCDYFLVVDEIVPSHQKPYNLFFWDWIFENTSYLETMIVMHWILPQEKR